MANVLILFLPELQFSVLLYLGILVYLLHDLTEIGKVDLLVTDEGKLSFELSKD